MLSREDNELLTRVGPGTPMGRLMREYWIPAFLSSEVPAPECAPLRVMLLGERLIGFRDGEGRPGLMAEACPHRGASLFFATNEKCGLRCAYHGWQWDVAGACVNLPGDQEGPLKRKVRAVAYPCIERCGVVWAYMGPRKTPPPLPELEANMEGTAGACHAFMSDCNWLQTLEGDADWDHVATLHKQYLKYMVRLQEVPSDNRPLIEYQAFDTTAGFAAAARQEAPEGPARWLVGQFMFPFFGSLPYGGDLGSYFVMARVPMDDTHTMSYGMITKKAAQLPVRLMLGDPPQFLENTSDWYGRFRFARNSSNDFGLSPKQGPNERWVRGQAVQDAAIMSSQGAILDRSHEHLGPFDVPVIHLRNRLLSALRDFDTDGAPGVDAPTAYRLKQGWVQVDKGVSWFDELCKSDGATRSATPTSR